MTGASPVDLSWAKARKGNTMGKVQSEFLRDLFDPGWREREAEIVAKFLAFIPMRCGCKLGTCESKSEGCRMCEEIKPGSGAQ